MFCLRKSFALLLSLSFLAANPSFAMFDSSGENLKRSSAPPSLNLDNPEDTYMVHLSRVMSENSTKIAGGMLLTHDLTTLDLKKATIYVEGSMIRSRITLHHCLGGVVPESTHGLPINTLLGKVKLPSDLHTNKDVCAYLDPLSEFKGELIGGLPEDMISIDRHTYKNKSIVIIPNHRVEEFKLQNPGFLGKIIQFDSNKITVAAKVEEVISQSQNQISLKELYQQVILEIREKKFDTLKSIEETFKINGLMFDSHESTAFRAMEHLFQPLYNQIDKSYQLSNRSIFSFADQVLSRLAMIRSLLDIALDSSLGSLNDEKKSAMKNWKEDTLNWLNLFELDANLRQAAGTTLFINNPRLGIFIQNRANKEKLRELARSLPLIEDEKELNLYSQELFPELICSFITSGPGWNDFIQHTDFQILLKLKMK